MVAAAAAGQFLLRQRNVETSQLFQKTQDGLRYADDRVDRLVQGDGLAEDIRVRMETVVPETVA